MSFKKLNDLFIESDKFSQVVKPAKTSDVQNSTPTELSTPAMTPTKFAAQLSNIDAFQNVKATGFNKPNVGQTEFQNVSNTPLSQQGLDGELGPAFAENNLLTDKTTFRPKLKTLADTLFEQKIVDKSQGSIIGTSLKNEEIAFDKDFKVGDTSLFENALGNLGGPYAGGGILSGKGIGAGFAGGYVGGILDIDNPQVNPQAPGIGGVLPSKKYNHQGFIPNQRNLQPRLSDDQMIANANKKSNINVNTSRILLVIQPLQIKLKTN